MVFQAVRAAAAALVLALPWAASAQSCMWFGQKDGLMQVQTETNAVSAIVSIGHPDAIAMNGQDCGLWKLDNKRLRRHDATGVLQQEISLAAIHKKLVNAAQLAVDPYDGSVWVLDKNVLAHLSSMGSLLSLHDSDGATEAAIVGQDQSVWVLDDKRILRFGATGAALPSVELNGAIRGNPKHLAFDEVGGVVWLATSKNLVQLNLAQPNPPTVAIRNSEKIVAITLDPFTRQLWIADAGTVYGYDATGALVKTIDVEGLGLGKAEHLAFDPVQRSLWVSSKKGVARLSPAGQVQATFPGNNADALLAVPGLRREPLINLAEPPQDARTNNPRRSVAIAYGAQCNGQPCDADAGYLSQYRLTALVNGQEVGAQFSFDSATRSANYTPSVALPEGRNTLHAQARDLKGRLSNTIDAQFTVDTVAPTVTIASPQNGSVTSQAAQTIRGSLSEPAALVVNDTSTPASASGTFTVSVTLQEGINRFRLTAVDRAGNTGQAQLVLRLATQGPAAPVPGSITVTAPAAGTVSVTGAAGTVGGSVTVSVTNVGTGDTASALAAANGSFSVQIAARGGDLLSVRATDGAGNAGAATIVSVPPDSANPGNAASSQHGYDATGRSNSTVDANGLATQKSYDSLGRLIRVQQPPNTGSTTPTVIQMGYDLQDRLASVADPRNLTTGYSADGLGNLRTETSPDAGTMQRSHDAKGNLLASVDARGKQTSYSYDSLDRVTGISYASGAPTSFQYDGGASPSPGQMGELTRMSDESGQTRYSHDALGRLTGKIVTIGGRTFTVSYSWGNSGSALDKLTAITYPGGSRVNYLYDEGLRQRDHGGSCRGRHGEPSGRRPIQRGQPGERLAVGGRQGPHHRLRQHGPSRQLQPGRPPGQRHRGGRAAHRPPRQGRPHHRLHAHQPRQPGQPPGPGLRL